MVLDQKRPHACTFCVFRKLRNIEWALKRVGASVAVKVDRPGNNVIRTCHYFAPGVFVRNAGS